MNTDKAKQTLENYRSGDELTADIAEALTYARNNADVSRWFDDKEQFDARMAMAVQKITVPSQLKSAILAQRRIIPLRSWWNQPVPLAAAALILGLIALSGFFLTQTKPTFAAYRKAVIDESWGRSPHLDIETQDIAQLNHWLASIDPQSKVSIPSGLQDLRLRGGRTMEWNGERVVLLCLSDGSRHLHLFVTDDHAFVDAPRQSSPDYEKCGGWKTVSWSQGDRAYVLTGMNYLTFLKKFRHSGHWTIDG